MAIYGSTSTTTLWRGLACGPATEYGDSPTPLEKKSTAPLLLGGLRANYLKLLELTM